MSWREEILGALRTRFLTAPGLDQWQTVIYANRRNETEPTIDAKHIRETPFSISSSSASIGQAVVWREFTGTWQVMLCVPFDTDVFPALAFADTLELAFVTAPIFLTDGHVLRITNVLVGTPRPRDEQDAWIRVPVVISFIALLPESA